MRFFPFRTAFTLAGFANWRLLHATPPFAKIFDFVQNGSSLEKQNPLSWILLELRFLALRFKFLIQGIFRFAKASHPSHFRLRPACYTKSALLKFLAARSLNFASKFLFQEIFLLHSSLALAGFASLLSCETAPSSINALHSPAPKKLDI